MGTAGLGRAGLRPARTETAWERSRGWCVCACADGCCGLDLVRLVRVRATRARVCAAVHGRAERKLHTHADARTRMPNGTPARTSRAPARTSTRAILSGQRGLIAHKWLTARSRRARKGGRVHYESGRAAYIRHGTSLQQVRRPGRKCGAVVAHLSGVGRGEVLRHLV